VAEQGAGGARLQFVLSNDYGELSNALYFVKGGPFRPSLLMPDRLFAANREGLPVPAQRYGTRQDVIEAAAGEQPGLVFLFSGYLYAINNIFDEDGVEALVRSLRDAGHRLVTSDPFLGVLSRLGASTFSDRHPRKAWLTAHFARLARIFADVPHLYLAPLDGPGPARPLAFFNAHVLDQGGAAPDRAGRLAARLPIDPQRKRWLFVLSMEDYGGQVALHGRAAFDELLAQRLRQAAAAGRQPVLVAPQVCMESLRGRGSLPAGALLLPFCGHALFMDLLFDAEYVFYWNVFSNSIPARVVNRRPVFFFDSGHMARSIPPLFEAGMRCYYAGAELPSLDPRAPLAAAALAALAARQEGAFEPAREAFRRSPGPEAVVDGLMRNPARG
jgi:hypothetical protein